MSKRLSESMRLIAALPLLCTLWARADGMIEIDLTEPEAPALRGVFMKYPG